EWFSWPRASSDEIFRILTAALASAIIVIIALSAWVLVQGSFPVFQRFGLSFLTGVRWDPVAGHEVFGALPYLLGTIVTSAIAIIVGVPVSLGIAIFLSEMAPSRIKAIVSSMVELLAAVPSVIYGLWGLFVFRFWVSDLIEKPLVTYFGQIPVFQGTPFGLDILTAGLILAIMIIPTVSSISKE